MRRMSSMELLHDKAAELIDAAEAFHYAADQTGIRPAVPVSLARTEEALRLLSAAWYQLAADASPRIASRPRQPSVPDAGLSEIDSLSHEQEVRLPPRCRSWTCPLRTDLQKGTVGCYDGAPTQGWPFHRCWRAGGPETAGRVTRMAREPRIG
jgi:hypothetical protein